MKRALVITAFFMGLGAPWWLSGAVAMESVSAADEIAIHAVVQSQLDALADDDAVSAFELASPATRMQIGSPDNFLRLIKEQYNPIYRNQRALFSAPEVVNGDTIQIVRLTDHESHVWLAIFRMQRESDDSWKIDGCQLIETTSVSI